MRQWLYPRAFRIGPARDAGELEALAPILESLQREATRLSNMEAALPSRNSGWPEDDASVADLATRVWRIRVNLCDAETREPLPDTERARRHIERFVARLEEHGVTIVDPTGEPYDAGMSVHVVTSEPAEGVRRAFVKETLIPTVYRGDRMIQQADVIVVTPQGSQRNV
jgi:hypothetical protein